jgi:hypothetical protein
MKPALQHPALLLIGKGKSSTQKSRDGVSKGFSFLIKKLGIQNSVIPGFLPQFLKSLFFI